MSKYACELHRRIFSGDSLQKTAEWFIKCLANEPKIRDADFTPIERAFREEIVEGYTRWKKRYRVRQRQ
jgi:hypothetical protein